MTEAAIPRRRPWRIACSLALLALLAVACRGVADGLFFRPDALVHGTPEQYALVVDEVGFSAPGGPRLTGWWAPARSPARGTVVYCHGNNRNLTHHARFVAWLPERGFNLLLFDYRGYGRSEGAPSRDGAVADTLAAVDFALQRDPDRTLVFGHSLGGALGIVAAAQRPSVRAVVVESSFPSYRAAARCTAPLLGFLVPWLVSSGQDPIDWLAHLPPRPLLVVHGSEDTITPPRLGFQLYEAAGQPKRMMLVEGAGHRSPWTQLGGSFEDVLVRFFADAMRG